ncbi:MAG TPA: hypothetical protein HPQ04_14610 [Rhodospirillaceae bacterium]|nr:hypothetical protein [Rhodospirillaceae bacterium]
MSAEGRAEIRQIAEAIILAFLRAAEEKHGGRAVAIAELRGFLPAFGSSPGFVGLMKEAHARLLDAAADELLRQQRGDPFQRLMVHPLTGEFESETLSRDILPAYFSFLHLVLGDDKESRTAVCADLVAVLKEPDALMFSWDHFYDHLEAKRVLWSVLLRIADAFKRFDARRDWFIGLMQHRPQAVSLGPQAFLPRPSNEEAHPFGRDQFNILFGSLYRPLRHLAGRDLDAFCKLAGGPPEMVLNRFLSDLEASGAEV